jgi:hypothetical protein
VTNKWLPLKPGTQWVYEGRITEEKRRLSHRVVTTVTDLTKVIDGVGNVVILDRDYNAGRLVEGEITFHAQDDDGNIWNFGEYPEEYENGKFEGAPDTWIAGLAGAKAGVVMRADPRVGTTAYGQGWAPRIDFADRARVFATGQRTCVPVDCYRNVLITDEWNPYERGAHERKFYAPGVGNVRVGFAGGEEKETLVLVRFQHLSATALAQARDKALELEQRAYRVQKSLYGRTPPAERQHPGGSPG